MKAPSAWTESRLLGLFAICGLIGMTVSACGKTHVNSIADVWAGGDFTAIAEVDVKAIQNNRIASPILDKISAGINQGWQSREPVDVKNDVSRLSAAVKANGAMCIAGDASQAMISKAKAADERSFTAVNENGLAVYRSQSKSRTYIGESRFIECENSIDIRQFAENSQAKSPRSFKDTDPELYKVLEKSSKNAHVRSGAIAPASLQKAIQSQTDASIRSIAVSLYFTDLLSAEASAAAPSQAEAQRAAAKINRMISLAGVLLVASPVQFGVPSSLILDIATSLKTHAVNEDIQMSISLTENQTGMIISTMEEQLKH